VKPNRSKTKKTYERVAEHVKRLIEQGLLLPGDKLPSMIDLAKEFGVSRATVREAFSSLVGMGLIDLRHGEGTFVRRVDVQTMITEPMNAAILLGMGDLQALLDVRRLLEAGSAQWACERRTAQHLDLLAAAVAAMDPAVERGLEDRVGADLQFHLALAEAAGNDVLRNLLNVLGEAVRSVLRTTWEAQPIDVLYAEHRAILDAVRAQDAARAVQLVDVHLRQSEQLLRTKRTTDQPGGA